MHTESRAIIVPHGFVPPNLDGEITSDRFLHNDKGTFVTAYVASQLGFNVPGRYFLENLFYPELKKRKVWPYCPFDKCKQYVDIPAINACQHPSEQMQMWESSNRRIEHANYCVLMPASKMMIAILDGGHAVDDGVAAEMAHFAAHYGPVVGIRSDFRISENTAAPVNLALRHFLDLGPYKGYFFQGIDAYDKALSLIETIANDWFRENTDEP